MSAFDEMSREDLRKALEMFAKSWLAHDGCWFLAAEEQFDLATAMELDAASWARFASVEARRIMSTFNIEENGGLVALDRALGLRMYSLINAQRTKWSDDQRHLLLTVDLCRVQEGRRRKGLTDFPCKSVGKIEFEIFARTVDSRIQTRCLHCPPDAGSEQYCGWEFSLDLSDKA